MLKDQQILISVCVVTFNQELYISKCIDSILSQKVTGKIEILVADDCSTDKTAEIVNEYVEKYPDVVRLLRNVSNLGAQSNFCKVLRAAQGEFIAVCDGDDYWNSSNKLELQLTALQESKLDLCFTRAIKFSNEGALGYIGNHGNVRKVVSYSDVIRGGGGFIPSPTIFYRRSSVSLLPSWFDSAPVGDYYLQILTAHKGAVYLPDVTASYRFQSNGSWSNNRLKQSSRSLLQELDAHQFTLDQINMSKDDRNFAYSLEIVNTAHLLLRKKQFVKAVELINLSWTYHSGSSRTQKYLYARRNFPRIALIELKAREGIKRLISYMRGK